MGLFGPVRELSLAVLSFATLLHVRAGVHDVLKENAHAFPIYALAL